jgi:hypothetical protein
MKPIIRRALILSFGLLLFLLFVGIAIAQDLGASGDYGFIETGGAGGWVGTATSDLNMDTYKITTGLNQDLILDPNGTGDINLEAGSGIVQVGTTPYAWGHSPQFGVEGIAEIDGALYADSTITSVGTISAQALEFLNVFNSSYGGMYRGNDDGVRIHMGVDGFCNNNLIITATGNRGKDHDHDTFSTNPTLIGHSNYDPDTNNTRYWAITHTGDAAAGVMSISTGAGSIQLGPADDAVIPDGDNEVDFGTSAASWKDIRFDGELYIDDTQGVTDNTSYWLCTAADCSTKCQVTIQSGIITGCT